MKILMIPMDLKYGFHSKFTIRSCSLESEQVPRVKNLFLSLLSSGATAIAGKSLRLRERDCGL